MSGLGLLLVGLAGPRTAHAEEPLPDTRVQFQWENDRFGGSDRFYTNGLRLSWDQAVLDPERSRQLTPDWLRGLGFTPMVGLSVFQTIFTPAELDPADPERWRAEEFPRDRPYAGWLSLDLRYGLATQTTEGQRLHVLLHLQFGPIGDCAGPGQVQTSWHRLLRSATGKDTPPDAIGWDIPSEPDTTDGEGLRIANTWGVNTAAQVGLSHPLSGKRGVRWGEVGTTLRLEAGNVYVRGTAVVPLRTGLLPPVLVSPHGPSLPVQTGGIPSLWGLRRAFRDGVSDTPTETPATETPATETPAAKAGSAGRWGAYAELAPSITGIAYDRMLDNRMFQDDSPAAVRRPWRAELPVGGVLWFRQVQVRYDQVVRTNELVDPPTGPDRKGPARPGRIQMFGRVSLDVWW